MAKKNNAKNSAVEAHFERKHMIADSMNFAASEAYKLLRTNILFSFSGSEICRVIGMTSAFKGEGKSITAINLAYTMAQANKDILLVEGDMRLPTLAKRLGLRQSPGVSNLMVGMNSVREAIQTFEVAGENDVVSVDVLVAGDIPPNPSELLGSERMEKLLAGLRERYDYIILDLPPVTAVTDAMVASKLIDGMVVVVRNDHAVRGALAQTIRQLQLVNTRILGFVYNGSSGSGGGYYKGKYGKGYYKNGYYSSDTQK